MSSQEGVKTNASSNESPKNAVSITDRAVVHPSWSGPSIQANLPRLYPWEKSRQYSPGLHKDSQAPSPRQGQDTLRGRPINSEEINDYDAVRG